MKLSCHRIASFQNHVKYMCASFSDLFAVMYILERFPLLIVLTDFLFIFCSYFTVTVEALLETYMRTAQYYYDFLVLI